MPYNEPETISAADYLKKPSRKSSPKRSRGSGESNSRDSLEKYLTYGGFGRVITEYQFHPTRKWRFDFYLPDQGLVAIEYDGLFGGEGANASHSSMNGILRDSEKINEAQALGYRVYRANAKTIQNGTFYELLGRVLERKERE